MLHSRRVWAIAPAQSAQWLAEQVTQYTWCGCNGFELSGYLFVNDATSADGAQEYGVLRRYGEGYVQIESLTFSWMTIERALSIIRRVLAGEFDAERYGHVAASQIETVEEHGHCYLCM